MNPQDHSAQNSGQTTPKPLTVDFKHRLCVFPRSNTDGLTDSISLMTERALGILFLLSGQFDGSSEARFSDEILNAAINAAINEVEDIQATVDAYLQIEREAHLQGVEAEHAKAAGTKPTSSQGGEA